MTQPKRFVDHSKPYHMYKLKKAFHGLKQTSRAWFDRFKIVMTTQQCFIH